MKPKVFRKGLTMNRKQQIDVNKKMNPNTVSLFLLGLSMVLIAFALAACGSSGDTTPPPVTNNVGTSGGTVTGPDGARVIIPEGALTQNTDITIT
jgi:hypothetical protein